MSLSFATVGVVPGAGDLLMAEMADAAPADPGPYPENLYAAAAAAWAHGVDPAVIGKALATA